VIPAGLGNLATDDTELLLSEKTIATDGTETTEMHKYLTADCTDYADWNLELKTLSTN